MTNDRKECEKECCNLNAAVKRYYEELKGYLINRTKDSDLSDDLVQEIMLKAAYAHKNGMTVGNIRAWFFQIARNTLADHYRKLSSQKQLIASLELVDQDEYNTERDLHHLIERYMEPMLALLPTKYSEPLILADLQNIPHKAIAIKLGLSVTAVKSRVQRARQKLIALMYECCDIELDSQGNFVTCTIKAGCAPLKHL